MSGFLDNVLNRALGRGPMLERRRPALFEPSAALPASHDLSSVPRAEMSAATTAAEPVDGDESIRPEAPSRPGVVRSAPAAVRSDPSPPGEAIATNTEVRPPRDRSVAELPSPRSTRAQAPRAVADATPGPIPARRAVGHRDDAIALRPSVREANTETPSRGRRGARRPDEGTWRPRASSAADAASAPEPDAVSVASESDAPSTIGSVGPTVRPELVAVARSATARGTSSHATPVERPVPTEPVVHVTIGRVEVRASHPAAQPRRDPSPRAPGLTLDAYLRERDGGSR